MPEITEREQKLIEIIIFLIKQSGLRTIVLRKIYDLIAWENDVTEKEKFDEHQDSMMKVLREEFDLDLKKADSHGNIIEESPEQ